MLIFKEKVFVLVEQVVKVDSVVIHHIVLNYELLLQKLRQNEEQEDSPDREKLYLPIEHELVVEVEV
jgi:hypothetical protein